MDRSFAGPRTAEWAGGRGGGVRRRAGRGVAPDRLPARARPRGHLQGQGVPRRRRRDPAAAATTRSAARVEAGTLTDLPGVGRQHRQGDRGRGRGELPRAAGRSSRRSTAARSPPAVTSCGPRCAATCTRHSDWSDGGSPIEEMAFTAMELGHDYLVLTDHSPRLRVANGLSAERLSQQLGVVDAVNAHLGGDAASPCSRGSRSTSSTTAASTRPTRCSTGSTSGSPASTPSSRWTPADMTRRMVAAVRNPRVNVLGHCTGRMVMGDRGTRPAVAVRRQGGLQACAEHDTAVEINSRPERRDPPTKLLELARDLGCLFSIDSDAHAPGPARLPLVRRASGPRRPASTRTGSSTPGRKERLLAWANPVAASAVHDRHGGRVGAGTEVEVRRSKRRRRTVSAYRDGDRIVVLIPASLTRKRGGRVGRDHGRPARSSPRSADAALRRRADGRGR